MWEYGVVQPRHRLLDARGTIRTVASRAMFGDLNREPFPTPGTISVRVICTALYLIASTIEIIRDLNPMAYSLSAPNSSWLLPERSSSQLPTVMLFQDEVGELQGCLMSRCTTFISLVKPWTQLGIHLLKRLRQFAESPPRSLGGNSSIRSLHAHSSPIQLFFQRTSACD